MKIDPKSRSLANAQNRQKANSALLALSKRITKTTKRIPQAFTAGKVHFSKKLGSDKSSTKVTRLVRSRLKSTFAKNGYI